MSRRKARPPRPSRTKHRLKRFGVLLAAVLVLLLCLSSATATSNYATPSATPNHTESTSPAETSAAIESIATTPAVASISTYRVPIIIRSNKPIANDPTLTDDAGYLVDHLVDHYPVMPAHNIYFLIPEHQYYFQLDLSAHQDRPTATTASVCASFVSSLPDDRIGFVNFSLTETYPDGTKATFSDRLAFMADCPEGISLSLVQPANDAYSVADNFNFTLEVLAGQVDKNALNQTQTIHIENNNFTALISGNPQYVSYSPELDPDLVQWYLWPNGEYTYDYPWPGGTPDDIEAVG